MNSGPSRKTGLLLPERLRSHMDGEVEIEIRDLSGRKIGGGREHNIIKIQSKEIISHRVPYGKVWDPNSGTGGEWVSSGIDVNEDLAVKYICFGASFDAEHNPLDVEDERFYTFDAASNSYVAKSLGVGAEFGGGLINPIPISEPTRPLKRIERVYFEPSYQPADTPLLQDDVRALNNVMVLETTLRKDEYNGFGITSSDYFTLTEVALAAGKELGNVGACELDPHDLFLEGDHTGHAIDATANGTATVTLNTTDADLINLIKEGDQVKLVAEDVTADSTHLLGQVTPFYLVISKVHGGSDIVLDRVPMDSHNNVIHGPIGLFRDSFRIFSHRILKVPYKKSQDFEIVVRWRIAIA